MERRDENFENVRLEMEQTLRRLMGNVRMPDVTPALRAIEAIRPQIEQFRKTHQSLVNGASMYSSFATQRNNLGAECVLTPRALTIHDVEAAVAREFSRYQVLRSEKLIEITLSSSGIMRRGIGNKILSCSFQNSSKRLRLINFLLEHRGRTLTKVLVKYLNTTEDSFYKTVRELNIKIGAALGLPENERFIDGERMSGYQINPKFCVVSVD